MSQWLLDSMQLVHLVVFAVVSISVEWRRPGLILAGFALLYLALAAPVFDGYSVNMLFREYDSPRYMLMWVALDMLGAALIFDLCRPGKDNTSFKRWNWFALAGVLIAFWIAHYLNFCYTMGYKIHLATPVYDKVTVALALFTLLIVWPGIRSGIYEIKRLASKALAGDRIFGYQPYSSVFRKPGSGKMARAGDAGDRGSADVPVAYGPGQGSGRERL